MPLYGISPPVGLFPGNQIKLWNAESPAAAAASISFACFRNPDGKYAPLIFDLEFNSAPTAGDQVVQGAMTDSASAYQTLYTCTAAQQQVYGDQGMYPFYRMLTVGTSGQPLTVTAQR